MDHPPVSGDNDQQKSKRAIQRDERSQNPQIVELRTLLKNHPQDMATFCKKLIRVCPIAGVSDCAAKRPIYELSEGQNKGSGVFEPTTKTFLKRCNDECRLILTKDQKNSVTTWIDTHNQLLSEYLVLVGIFQEVSKPNLLPKLLSNYLQPERESQIHWYCSECHSFWTRKHSAPKFCCFNFYGQDTGKKKEHSFMKVYVVKPKVGEERGNLVFVSETDFNNAGCDWSAKVVSDHPNVKFLLSRPFYGHFSKQCKHYEKVPVSDWRKLLEHRKQLIETLQEQSPLLATFEDPVTKADLNNVHDEWVVNIPWTNWPFLKYIPPPSSDKNVLKASDLKEPPPPPQVKKVFTMEEKVLILREKLSSVISEIMLNGLFKRYEQDPVVFETDFKRMTEEETYHYWQIISDKVASKSNDGESTEPPSLVELSRNYEITTFTDTSQGKHKARSQTTTIPSKRTYTTRSRSVTDASQRKNNARSKSPTVSSNHTYTTRSRSSNRKDFL